MAHLIRMIQSTLWKKGTKGEILGRSVQDNLNVDQNSHLSVWLVNDDSELENAQIAILSSFRKSQGGIEFLKIDLESINNIGCHLLETPGDTPLKLFCDRHRDIAELSIQDLHNLSQVVDQCIATAIENDSLERFKWKRIVKMIAQAVGEGKLNWDDLHECYRESIPNPN